MIVGLLGVSAKPAAADTERINLGEALDSGLLQIIPDRESYTYTGNPIEPSFKVVYNGTELTAGTDYDYMYRDNNDIGYGLIVIDGAGKYVDRAFTSFRIVEPAATPTPTPEATATPATPTPDETASPTESPEATAAPATPTPTVTPAGKYKISSYSKKVKLNQSSITLFYLNKKAKRLYTGEIMYQFRGHMTLKVLNTKKTVTYSSSNYGVATVDSNGVVKAVKPGKCTVTAKAGSKAYKCKVTVKSAYSYSKSYIKNHVKCSFKDDKNGVIRITVKNKMSVPMFVSYWLDEAGYKSYRCYEGVVPAKSTIRDYIQKNKKKAKVKFYRLEVGFTGGGGPSRLNGHYDKYEGGKVFCYGSAEMQPVKTKEFSIRYSNLKLKKEDGYHRVYATVKIRNKLPYGVWWTIPFNAYALFYKKGKLVAAIELFDYDIAKRAFGFDNYYIPKGFSGTVKNYRVSGLSTSWWNGKYDKVKVVYNKVDLRTDRMKFQ